MGTVCPASRSRGFDNRLPSWYNPAMTRIFWIVPLLAFLGAGLAAQADPGMGFFEEGEAGPQVKAFVLALDGGWTMNCYLAWDPVTRQALVIDPGAAAPDLLDFVRQQGLQVLAVLNTHGHTDHVGGNAWMAARLETRFFLHRADRSLAAKTTGPAFVFSDYPADGRLRLGSLEVEVIPTPGHTPGSVCFRTRNILFSGDTLFAGGVGKAYGGTTRQRRTNLQMEVDVIRKRLLPLPALTRVFPGHGPATTIGAERAFNRFVR